MYCDTGNCFVQLDDCRNDQEDISEAGINKFARQTEACWNEDHWTSFFLLLITTFYGPLIQDNPGEPVLSQRRLTVWSTPERLRGEVLTTRRYTNLRLPLPLLKQPLDFLWARCPTCLSTYSVKHYRKTQWFGRLLLYRHGISNQQCQSTEGNSLLLIMFCYHVFRLHNTYQTRTVTVQWKWLVLRSWRGNGGQS